jgi:hypothetical protein
MRPCVATRKLVFRSGSVRDLVHGIDNDNSNDVSYPDRKRSSDLPNAVIPSVNVKLVCRNRYYEIVNYK